MPTRTPMTASILDTDAKRTLLAEARTIAVLGAHTDLTRPAAYVPDYLRQMGYRILPVNATKVGEAAHGGVFASTLAELEGPVDIVDVFRPSAALMGHLDDILAMRPLPRAVWLQLGIDDAAFVAALLAAGVDVVRNACALQDHQNLAIGHVRGADAGAGGDA